MLGMGLISDHKFVIILERIQIFRDHMFGSSVKQELDLFISLVGIIKLTTVVVKIYYYIFLNITPALMLQQSVWLEDAFDRAKQLYLSYYRSIPKSLERSTAHKLMLAMLGGDERFVEPTPNSLQHLTLEQVKNAVMRQFVSDNMEVSIYPLLVISCKMICVTFLYFLSYGMSSHVTSKGFLLLCFSMPPIFCLAGEYCWGFHRRGYRVLYLGLFGYSGRKKGF